MATGPMIDLIYCAGGNARFAKIAIDHGFLYGAQIPSTFYYPLWFADQNWKKPNREEYVKALSIHKPHMATVLDLERPNQVDEVLGWGEDIAPFVEVVMMIPKYKGAIADIPLIIGGKPVRLGYSIPTEFGGTSVPLRDFYDWPVHLLGGGPTIQMELCAHLNVVSADGNAAQKAAIRGFVFAGTTWEPLRKYVDYEVSKTDMMYRAFDISCENIRAGWQLIASQRRHQ